MLQIQIVLKNTVGLKYHNNYGVPNYDSWFVSFSLYQYNCVNYEKRHPLELILPLTNYIIAIP